MTEFLKPSEKINQIAAHSTSFEQLREEMKAQLVRDGTISRDQETQGYGVYLLRQPEPTSHADVPENSAPDTCVRVIYPAGNNRFEIYGSSESDLDDQERKIRAVFEGAR